MDSTARRKRPTGRRPGDSGTREAILDTALDLFAAQGYDGTSMRAVAAAAGVDPALIRHFFGDKDGLFAAVLADRSTIPDRMTAVVGENLGGSGRAVVESYLRQWEDPATGPMLLAMVRSATTSEHAARMLADTLWARAAHYAGVDVGVQRRMALAGAQLFGLAVARYVLRLPPVVDATVAELVDEVAPTIQRYLAGEHR